MVAGLQFTPHVRVPDPHGAAECAQCGVDFPHPEPMLVEPEFPIDMPVTGDRPADLIGSPTEVGSCECGIRLCYVIDGWSTPGCTECQRRRR